MADPDATALPQARTAETARTNVSVGFTIHDLLPSWDRHLRSTGKAPRTRADYLKAGRQLADWLDAQGMPTDVTHITREHIEAFIVAELERTSASTAASAYRRIQQLFRWLTEDDEIPSDPMAKMKPPAVTETPVPVISTDELKALLEVCRGNGFVERRDTAIIRLMVDSGGRRSEIAGIRLEHIDWTEDLIRVFGKGRGGDRPRDIPFGAKTGQALDRYVRIRARHPSAHLPWLWLGAKGRFTGSGLAQMLTRRAEQAGIRHIHPHMFRHTFSHRWLASGGQEGDLMRINGWSSRDMLDRYAKSAAEERARKAHRELGLGDEL